MAKRRKTTDTTRSNAELFNPQPETADHEVKAAPVSKTLVSEIPVTDLLNDLREVGGRDSDAIRELGRRYDGFIDRRLRGSGIRDWQDRESLKQSIWLKVQKLVRRAPGEKGAWDPRRAAGAADPLLPLLSSIASSEAIDLVRKRDRARKRIEGYLEDLKHWGDDVSDYAFTTRGARRRIAAKEIVSEEPKAFEPGVTRRAAAAARGHLLATVAGLPEKIRRPLLLEAEGQTCVQIAKVIGVVPSTAWKRADKAKVCVRASCAARAG